jgi:hypothetical protein
MANHATTRLLSKLRKSGAATLLVYCECNDAGKISEFDLTYE